MEVLQDTYTKIGLNLEILNGFPAKSTFFNNENKGLPLIRIRNILKGHSETYYSGEFDSKYLIKNGDILIGMDGDFNIAKWTGIPSILNQRICKLIDAKDPFSLEYLYYYLEVELKKIQARTPSTTVKHLSIKDLRKVNAYCPPLPEQQKIADILSTVDEQISTTDKIIEKSKELKKGLMQRFFLNKAYMIMSLGKLEKTELMPIRFNQLGKILTGTTPPTANNEYYDSEDYMFIGPADLGKVKDVKSSKKYISVKGFDVTRKLPENALMVVCIGATIGKIGLTTEPCATNQQVNTIVPKDEYSARYLYYVIGGLKKYLLGFAGDTATPQLNKTDFGKVVTFIHKSKSERTKIATILSEADAKIEKEQTQKVQLQALKKGLMQQLLTGKKRVKV